MPRLIALVPCQKVVIDKDDNSLNLFGVIESIRAVTGPGAPSQTVVPYQWVVLCIWVRDELTVKTNGEQRVTLTSPTGKVLFEPIQPLSFNSRVYRAVMKLDAIPIEENGQHVLAAYWREAGEAEWIKAAEYPMMLIKQVIERVPTKEEAIGMLKSGFKLHGDPASDRPSSLIGPSPGFGSHHLIPVAMHRDLLDEGIIKPNTGTGDRYFDLAE